MSKQDDSEQLWHDPDWRCPNPECRFINLAVRRRCRNCGYDSNAGEFPYYNPMPPYDAPNQEKDDSVTAKGPHGRIIAYDVRNDDDGDWHQLTFEDGWQILIFTDRPLVIIEPQKH